MIEAHEEAVALVRTATAAIAPMRERHARLGNGFMSLDDAARFRLELAEVRRFRSEGERLARRIDWPWFMEWVEATREMEAGMRQVEASMRPVAAS